MEFLTTGEKNQGSEKPALFLNLSHKEALVSKAFSSFHCPLLPRWREVGPFHPQVWG